MLGEEDSSSSLEDPVLLLLVWMEQYKVQGAASTWSSPVEDWPYTELASVKLNSQAYSAWSLTPSMSRIIPAMTC